MDKHVIDAVAAAGFDVWMRDLKDTYMLFTDGKNIGYLQNDRMAGYTISTVHKPNTTSGTGYQIERHVTTFTKEMLQNAFVRAPHWAYGRDIDSVRKYKDMDDYRAGNSFNASYQLVAKAQ